MKTKYDFVNDNVTEIMKLLNQIEALDLKPNAKIRAFIEVKRYLQARIDFFFALRDLEKKEEA